MSIPPPVYLSGGCEGHFGHRGPLCSSKSGQRGICTSGPRRGVIDDERLGLIVAKVSEVGADLPAIGVSRVGKTHCAISYRGQCLTGKMERLYHKKNSQQSPFLLLLLPSPQPVHWESKPETQSVCLFVKKFPHFQLCGCTGGLRVCGDWLYGLGAGPSLLLPTAPHLLLGLQSMADIDLPPLSSSSVSHPSQGELTTMASRPTGAISRVQIYMCVSISQCKQGSSHGQRKLIRYHPLSLLENTF